jgi:hypothetical protein
MGEPELPHTIYQASLANLTSPENEYLKADTYPGNDKIFGATAHQCETSTVVSVSSISTLLD